jgi:alkylation response protein AidB-like acyl-CoA dehydrogenase
MDFSLSEEYLMIRDAARDFARTELPGVERDDKQQFPTEQVKKWANLALGMMVDPAIWRRWILSSCHGRIDKDRRPASVIVLVNNFGVLWIAKFWHRSTKQNT